MTATPVSTPRTQHSENSNASSLRGINARRRPVALLACTHCRHKHLKCDARFPSCGRCRSEGRQCQYLESRRGHRAQKQYPDLQSDPNRPDRERVDDVIAATGIGTREHFSESFPKPSAIVRSPLCVLNPQLTHKRQIRFDIPTCFH